MKRLNTSLCLAAALISITASVRAQDFQHEGPKPVPPVSQPGSVPVTTTTSASHPGDVDKVLLKQLKGVVFVSTPRDVSSGAVKTEGITLRDVAVPNPDKFKTKFQSYIGHPLTRGALGSLIQDVIAYYRAHDRPVVDVIAPEQEITGGVIQLVILEGKVGSVTVAGNHWFDSDDIRDEVHLHSGGGIRAEQLQRDLDWLNQNPFHSTDVIYQPGKGLAQTDVVLQTQDRFPVRFYTGYEDSGNISTGYDRYLAGFNWGDAFGIGEQLNYQYTTSGDGDSLRSHSGSYIIPLPWRHTLTFFGSYADTKGLVSPFTFKGRSYQISGRYGIPLPILIDGKLTYRENFSFGFDYKYNDNSAEFGGVPTGTNPPYDIDQFVFAYDGTETDAMGQTTINETLNYSPGNWGGNNNAAAFSPMVGATSDYIYDNIALSRLTKLPYDFSLMLRGTLQTSNSNLTPSEQLGLGGYDTVRGYSEREVNTDEGYIFSTEVRTPPISFGQLGGLPVFKDQLQFLGFWDYGSGKYHDPEGGRLEIPLSSVGAGLRYTINTYVSVRFDYGFQLLRTGFDNDHGSRSDLGVVISY